MRVGCRVGERGVGSFLVARGIEVGEKRSVVRTQTLFGDFLAEARRLLKTRVGTRKLGVAKQRLAEDVQVDGDLVGESGTARELHRLLTRLNGAREVAAEERHELIELGPFARKRQVVGCGELLGARDGRPST